MTSTAPHAALSAFSRRDGRLHAEDVAVESIALQVGTPAFIYSGGALAEAYDGLDRAFASTPHLICYSIKSNMNLAVVRTFLDRGCGVDVTSGGELARALHAGADPARIVYSGVGKRTDELERALGVGLRMFNVESLDELLALDGRAGALGVVAPIAFRLNPNVDPRTHPNISTGLRTAKFGIPIEEAPEAYARAKSLAHVHVVGVDCLVLQYCQE